MLKSDLKCDYELKFEVTDPNEIVKLALDCGGDIVELARAVIGEQRLGLCPWGSCQYAFDNVIFDTLVTIMKTKDCSFDELVAEFKFPWNLGQPAAYPFLAAKIAIIQREGSTVEEFPDDEHDLDLWNYLFHSTTFEELFITARKCANHLYDPTNIIFKAVFPNIVNQDKMGIGEQLFILYAKDFVKDPSCYIGFDT